MSKDIPLRLLAKDVWLRCIDNTNDYNLGGETLDNQGVYLCDIYVDEDGYCWIYVQGKGGWEPRRFEHEPIPFVKT